MLDARLEAASVQGVAKEVLGADRSQKWDTDGGERSKAYRRIRKAKAFMEERYREFLEPGGGGRRRPASAEYQQSSRRVSRKVATQYHSK